MWEDTLTTINSKRGTNGVLWRHPHSNCQCDTKANPLHSIISNFSTLTFWIILAIHEFNAISLAPKAINHFHACVCGRMAKEKWLSNLAKDKRFQIDCNWEKNENYTLNSVENDRFQSLFFSLIILCANNCGFFFLAKAQTQISMRTGPINWDNFNR